MVPTKHPPTNKGNKRPFGTDHTHRRLCRGLTMGILMSNCIGFLHYSEMMYSLLLNSFAGTILLLHFVGVELSAQANQLELPSVFSDHMVLQRDSPVNVWGRAQPGAEVLVSFSGQNVNGKADAEGTWNVQLQPMDSSSNPQTMEVRSGPASVHFRDVLVGDVWLCSGQSNMVWMLRTVADGDIETTGSNMSRLRLFQVGRKTEEKPRFSSGDKWMLCDSASSAQFSAIAYFFGKKLHQTLNIPIGLIESSWSGTPIAAWTGERSLLAHVHTKTLVESWDASIKRRNFDPKVALHRDRPGILASSMLTPVCPFSLKGCIWYQGEDDIVWEPDLYDLRLGIMLDDWKQRWGQTELPFGIVQLANFGTTSAKPVDSNWARIRDCQLRFSLKTPGVGLIVAIDQGETDNVHPARKQVLGNRLARWALTDVYRKINLAGGPIIRKFEAVDGGIEVAFDNVGKGLIALHGGPLREFAIAGDDRIFHRANAAIVAPDRVIVRSDAVAEPVAVRYAWADNPIHANLYNDQRLPASPFRTDNWEKTLPKDHPK